jgi:hypothetical protein
LLWQKQGEPPSTGFAEGPTLHGWLPHRRRRRCGAARCMKKGQRGGRVGRRRGGCPPIYLYFQL